MVMSNLKLIQEHAKKANEGRASRQTPEQVRKRLTAKPSRKWKCNEGKHVLCYELHSMLNKQALRMVRDFSQHSPFLNWGCGGEMEIAVRHSTRSVRVEGKTVGLFGDRFVYIRDDELGLLYLDPKDKNYLQLDPDQVPESHLDGEIEASIDNICEEEHEGKRVHRVDVQITRPLSTFLRFWLWDDAESAPFRDSVYGLVLGCVNKLDQCNFPIQELIKLGIPIKGEVRLGPNDEPVSRFFLQDLRLESFSAADFDIPGGYRDLRTKNKAPKKGHRYGAARRFSDLRRGHVQPEHYPRFDTGTSATQQATHALNLGSAYFGEAVNFTVARPGEFGCRCLPSTYGSQIATEFEQVLADDLRFLVNQVTRRLDGFNGNAGNLDIDWLAQFKAHSDNLPQGDGLYCFLRDEPDPGAVDPVEQMGGQGLLDQFVERTVRKLLVNLTTAEVTAVVSPPGSFSLAEQVTVSAALATAVLAVIGNTVIALADRFDNLTVNEQRDLREAYLAQNFAAIHLTYPSSTGAQSIFHDLLRVKLDNIAFDIAINNTQIIDTFTLGDNDIHILVTLPEASGSAFMSRWPSTLYWAVLGVGAIGCFFAPLLCSLLPFIAAVGAFLLMDFAFVSIELSNIELDAHIAFAPNAAGVLQPNTTFTLDADISVFYASVIPSGVHQILSGIYTIVGSHTDIVLSQIESQLNTSFNRLVRNNLGLSYPPRFGPTPLSGLASHAGGAINDHLYLEAELDAALLGVISPYITQVDTDIETRLLDFRAVFQGDVGRNLHHYGGFVFSQNFINHYIHILWRQGQYNYTLSSAEAAAVIEKLKTICPTCEIDEKMSVHLCAPVSPRLVFLPCGYEAREAYLTCFFDDLRLCVGGVRSKDEICVLELQFSAKVNAEIGFGAVNGNSGKLDIIKVSDRFMDVYFDLDEVGIEIIHPDTQGHAASGKCYDDFGCKELAEIRECFLHSLRAALLSRTNGVIPRGSGEPITVQTYTFAGQFLRSQFWVYRGNLYVHLGFGGPALLLFEGGLVDIGEIDCATGETLRLFV